MRLGQAALQDRIRRGDGFPSDDLCLNPATAQRKGLPCALSLVSSVPVTYPPAAVPVAARAAEEARDLINRLELVPIFLNAALDPLP
jgi:hypothetical protein